MNNPIEKQRIIYFDLLRVAATLAVIIIHISGSRINIDTPASLNWQIYNFYNGISRWCVPVFVMISGALFLKAEITLEKLFKKNILRIVTAFIFWSVAYGIFDLLTQNCGIKLALGKMLVGHYHMWFLFMIAGLYLAVPLLKKITESEKLMKYFLILSLVFSVIIPNVTSVVSLFSESIGDTLNVINDNINFKTAVGFSGYFVLGYYLSNVSFDKKQRKIIYILSTFGFAGTVVLSSLLSVVNNKTIEIFDGYFSATVLLESIGVFVLFKNIKCNLSEKAVRKLITLSEYSFGVYLVHPMILETLNELKFNVLAFNPLFSIPVKTIAAAVISFLISALIHRIPILKKYIV